MNTGEKSKYDVISAVTDADQVYTISSLAY